MYTLDGGTGLIYTTYDESAKYSLIGNENKNTIYSRFNSEYASSLFILYLEEDDEVQLWIPTTATTPDEVWCIDINKKVWYRKSRAMTGYGFYRSQSSVKIGDLVGTIGEQNYKYGSTTIKSQNKITLVGDVDGNVYYLNKATTNNNGVAIESEYQTKDFIVPDGKENQNVYMRVDQLLFEAKGAVASTFFSTDSGVTWSPCGPAVTLNAAYSIYQRDFDTVTRKIRFKFYKNALNSSLSLRYIGFKYTVRSGRV